MKYSLQALEGWADSHMRGQDAFHTNFAKCGRDANTGGTIQGRAGTSIRNERR
jgi:hypothetical protein